MIEIDNSLKFCWDWLQVLQSHYSIFEKTACCSLQVLISFEDLIAIAAFCSFSLLVVETDF